MEKKIPINITLPFRNYCEYKLELQVWDNHTCIYAAVQYHKNKNSFYDIKFNSEWIPKKQIEWLGNILLNNIIETVNKAESNTINTLANPIHEFKRLMNL